MTCECSHEKTSHGLVVSEFGQTLEDACAEKGCGCVAFTLAPNSDDEPGEWLNTEWRK